MFSASFCTFFFLMTVIWSHDVIQSDFDGGQANARTINVKFSNQTKSSGVQTCHQLSSAMHKGAKNRKLTNDVILICRIIQMHFSYETLATFVVIVFKPKIQSLTFGDLWSRYHYLRSKLREKLRRKISRAIYCIFLNSS